MCRGLNVKNTYLEACGDGGNVVVGGTKIGFIDLRWSETKLRERVGGRNASKNAAERFDNLTLTRRRLYRTVHSHGFDFEIKASLHRTVSDCEDRNFSTTSMTIYY